MSSIHIIHALDDTTEFLSVFKNYFNDNFFVIEPNVDSVNESISFLEQVPEEDLIVFLGHGHSTGLYAPESESFEKEIFIDINLANKVFKNKKVILLTCNSNQFIKKIINFRYIVGFGNILSSIQEVNAEAEVSTGIYRNLSNQDIEYFNHSYCSAVVLAIKKYQSGLYNFTELPKLIEFFINQRINKTLLKKETKNRVEIAKLLFEFRNEMDFC
tara:strand:- start:8620 stop:9264 length:645 start_codon:yes stop_codon:yes gene_type:complete